MIAIGKMMKFLFPEFIERMVYLDELLTYIVGLKILYNHSGLESHRINVNLKVLEFNKNKMWFMSTEELI